MIPSRAPPSSAFNKECNWLLDVTQSPRSEGVGSKIQSSLIPATQPRRGLLSTSSDRLDYAIEVPIGVADYKRSQLTRLDWVPQKKYIAVDRGSRVDSCSIDYPIL